MRRLVRNAALATAAAALALPAMLGTGSAIASTQSPGGGSTGSSDSGGKQGSGNDGGLGIKWNGSGNYKCDADQQLIKDNTIIWFEGPYSGCRGGVGVNVNTGRYSLCPIGFQVFRFYGNEATPVSAWTTSMLNLDRWCVEPGTPTADVVGGPSSMAALGGFWTTSFYDTQANVSNANYLTANTGKELGVRKPRLTQPGKVVAPRFAGVWDYSPDDRYSGAARPFAKSAASCTTAQPASHPIRSLLNDPNVSKAQKEKVREMIRAYFTQDVRPAHDGSKIAALKEVGLATFSIPKGKTWRQATFTWNTADCSSPAQFISTAKDVRANGTSDQPRQNRLTGVCYVPLERLGQEQSRGNRLEQNYPSINKGFGLRYSNVYRNTVSTKGRERGVNGKAPNKLEKSAFSAYRNTMRNWYNANTTAGINSLKAGKRASGPQIIPSSPYPAVKTGGKRLPPWNTNGYPHNTATAATALADWSRCLLGTRQSFTKPGGGSAASSNGDQVPDVVPSIRVTNLPVFQAGGVGRLQRLMFNPSDLACVANCSSPDAVRLERLRYNVAFTMPAGYRACAPGASTGCDFAVKSASGAASAGSVVRSADGRTLTLSVDRSGASAAGTLTVDLVFYRPSATAADKVTTSLSGAEATYTVRSSGWTLDTVTTKTGDGASSTSSTYSETSSEGVVTRVPGVQASPVPGTRSGGTWRYVAPVIGATSVR